jgi:hypothetical protein
MYIVVPMLEIARASVVRANGISQPVYPYTTASLLIKELSVLSAAATSGKDRHIHKLTIASDSDLQLASVPER